jgi:hypothetical protein
VDYRVLLLVQGLVVCLPLALAQVLVLVLVA